MEDTTDNLNWLLSDFDASHWAEQFCKRNPHMDYGLMHSWFACAIMTGYDFANRQETVAE